MSESINAAHHAELFQAISELMFAAGNPVVGDEIWAKDIEASTRLLKDRIARQESAAGSGRDHSASGGNGPHAIRPVFNTQSQILIVGELGIITYQLKMALARIGSQVTIIKGVEEAVTEFRKRNYRGVLIDIFMPTEREGLMVLREIRRLATENHHQTELIVLSSSQRDQNSNLQDICKQNGAGAFIEKIDGWHQRVIDLFQQAPPTEGNSG